jgi:MFS family permease
MGLVRHAIRISNLNKLGKHEMMTALLHHQLTVSCSGLNPEAVRQTGYGKKRSNKGTPSHDVAASASPGLPILLGASLMLTLSMGIRQSLGIFMQPLTRDIGISISEFTVAIAIQNLAWGFTSRSLAPMPRYGFRPVLLIGAGLYIAGLVLMAASQGFLSIMIGAGVLIGTSLSCIASSVSMAVAARSVPTSSRSLVLGIVSAAGSLGALIAAPLGQALNQEYGWRIGIAGFIILSLARSPRHGSPER